MYVNPFWFGILITLIVEIVIIFAVCFFFGITGIRYEEDDDAEHSEKRN